MTKDHIVPKKLGGKDILSNYQTMCTLCNGDKGAKRLNNDDMMLLQSVKDRIAAVAAEQNSSQIHPRP